MHPQIRQPGSGNCPICGMALEPEEPSLDDAPNPELVDFTRRWWVSAVLSVPLLVLTMGTDLFGLRIVSPAISPWLQLALAAPIVLWAGAPFVWQAYPQHDGVHLDKLDAFLSRFDADADLRAVDAVVLPGGFSYGDYLRSGAMAARSPVMGAVAKAAEKWDADRIVAEANNGGEMVRSCLIAAGASVRPKLVHASRGKVARAEPVAIRFEAGQAWFAGTFPALEDELAGLSVGGHYQGPGRSPDRADAMVWAFHELAEGKTSVPGIRPL